jgi:hypothetical protein
MRYKVKGVEIRSENAAKPTSDTAAPLVAWLRKHDHVDAALDYGCGKLRYTKYVAMLCNSLGLVDSNIQLTRTQHIDGHVTTVTEYAKMKWPKCKTYKIEEFWRGIYLSYDFILCANVLSVIPSRSPRKKSILAIRAALSHEGEILVVNQHTNSYFTKVKSRPSTQTHLDGWIAHSRAGASYYGILNRDKVIRLLKQNGFSIKDAWIEGQSNYVLATKK